MSSITGVGISPNIVRFDVSTVNRGVRTGNINSFKVVQPPDLSGNQVQVALEPDVLNILAEEINQALIKVTALHFSVDQDLDRVVVQVVDKNSEQIIRQVPSEDMLELVKRMRDLQGMLTDLKV